MSKTHDLSERLRRVLLEHQQLHDEAAEPRNRLRWLPILRAWQAARLEDSFRRFLRDPARRPAARFFLDDVYNDADFSRRDADIARVMPMMQALLPRQMLETLADAIELGAFTQGLDLRVAEALERMAPRRRSLDAALYARAYTAVTTPQERSHQIDLIARVGHGLGRALRTTGVGTLLKLARGPARAAGLGELQGFLERGVQAFSCIGDVDGFIDEIEHEERTVSARLFDDDPDPFRPV